MSNPAKSLLVVGILVFLGGLAYVIIPAQVVSLQGLPPVPEPWIRVLGITTCVVGFNYCLAATFELMPVFRASVYWRLVAAAGFLALVVLGLAGIPLLGYVALDAGGAIWTALALRSATQPALAGRPA